MGLNIRLRRGITRTVWLVGPYALKFPSLRYGGTFFVSGMLANLNEAWRYIDTRGEKHHEHLAPVLWCAWLGLLVIMRRAQPLTPCEPFRHHVFVEKLTTDAKRENFGWLRVNDPTSATGHRLVLVCIDYA